MKRDRITIVLLLLLAAPSVAWANAGTALMWAGIAHLFVGNLLIGVLEGLLLAVVFRRSVGVCVGLMILANYLSAWIGGHLIAFEIGQALPMHLENARSLLWLMVGITWLITLLMELPFVALAFRRAPGWKGRSIRASLLVQTVSYALLFGWYWLASVTSLYTKTEVADASSMALPGGVQVAFISAEDGDVYLGDLRERQWRKAFELGSTHWNDRLIVRPSAGDDGAWDLVARRETDDRDEPDLRVLRERCARVVPASERKRPATEIGTWDNFGSAPRLGDAEWSPWSFYAGFWAMEGLEGRNSKTEEKVRLALDTPFVGWSIRNVVHLPSDVVLFQLGDDQICVYDPERKQVALLARGRGPVVVGD